MHAIQLQEQSPASHGMAWHMELTTSMALHKMSSVDASVRQRLGWHHDKAELDTSRRCVRVSSENCPLAEDGMCRRMEAPESV